MGGAADLLFHLGGAFQAHGPQAAAVDGAVDDLVAIAIEVGGDAKLVEQCGNHGGSCRFR
ncbi:hypothetical protein D3C80_1940160 [compost metagenome]